MEERTKSPALTVGQDGSGTAELGKYKLANCALALLSLLASTYTSNLELLESMKHFDQSKFQMVDTMAMVQQVYAVRLLNEIATVMGV